MSGMVSRNRRLISLVAVHVFILILSISCGTTDSIGHGGFYLEVPNPKHGDVALRKVEFFLDEPVERGEMWGWVRAQGCDAYVYLCYHHECEAEYVAPADLKGHDFRVKSEDSVVFGDYLDDFVPCYKGGEMASEPMSCQRWNCDDSVHDITVRLESDCAAQMQVSLKVEYDDERMPFAGPLKLLQYIGDLTCDDCDN